MYFTCHRCLYEYSVMPFGLTNAPGIFLELMPIVLHGQGDFAMAYLVDIIIFSTSVEEDKKHIQKHFLLSKATQLKIKMVKMQVNAERNAVSGLQN